ncbi:bifunctional serine/threonine-protein kinase/formylglycine-generating enzyme family protein [Pseudomonadales bacterium]|nr:bifunctional serine/threonine-protein kinase/formylglycine-generating enzyme family protein [Pseudomonadales bacterium]
MGDNDKCPNQDELLGLNRADLPSEQLETICDHVESCTHCQRLLELLEEPPDALRDQLASISRDHLKSAAIAMAEQLRSQSVSPTIQLLQDTAPAVAGPMLKPPCQLRQYEVLRLIGTGGMGEVYEGRHTNLKRSVALKVIKGLRQDDPVAYQHFLREMETAGQLDHPNLVRTYDAWENDGCLYIAQELLNGDSLQHLASNDLIIQPKQIVTAILGTARALKEIHARGFVHRDVKPDNIMWLSEESIKLIDYGLAVPYASIGTNTKSRAGTIGYMAPEQYGVDTAIDHRTDLYSLGRCIEYLISALPADNRSATNTKNIKQLNQLAKKLTQSDPNDRPHDANHTSAQTNVKTAPLETQLQKPQHLSTHSGIKRLLVSTSILAIVVLSVLGAYQLITHRDSETIIRLVNQKPGDIISLSDEEGTQRSIELGDSTEFPISPGKYVVSLENSTDREITPRNFTITTQAEFTLRVEESDRHATAVEPATASLLATTSPPLELVDIPVGQFVMGSVVGDDNAELIEKPQRSIQIKMPFRMSAREITVGQFRKFTEATGYITDAESSEAGGWKHTPTSSFGSRRSEFIWKTPGYPVTDALPVTMVSHNDATAYCEWLSEKDGVSYRLPTEAEWEYACRAGSQSIFAFDIDALNAYVWYGSNAGRKPNPVGTKTPNAWGLWDMNGNVREWCLDWYDPRAYEVTYTDFPAGPPEGDVRVARGGCFINGEKTLRASSRQYVAPDIGLSTQGFRIVQDDLPEPYSKNESALPDTLHQGD